MHDDQWWLPALELASRATPDNLEEIGMEISALPLEQACAAWKLLLFRHKETAGLTKTFREWCTSHAAQVVRLIENTTYRHRFVDVKWECDIGPSWTI